MKKATWVTLTGLPRGAVAALLAAASEADAALKSSAADYLPIERLICSM